jgi:endonuclease/exonuclease/phosphatase family metal-dependent hydrolase
VPPFPKPRTRWDYDLADELAALRGHKRTRRVPARRDDRLLVATWNVANFGVQERREKDHRLLAEIIRWFDLVAIQEVAENLAGLQAVAEILPARYRLLISDTAGNDERSAFVYDSAKVELLELVGRLTVPPSDLPHVKLPGVAQPFRGFDRAPYLAAFRAGAFTFLLASVHLFFGSDDDPDDMDRRALEAFAIARWADLQNKGRYSYTRDVAVLGDFNLPAVSSTDPIFRALTRRGLVLPEHSSTVGGSSLGGSKHYDQLAIFAAETTELRQIAPFDFDNVLFRGLWRSARPKTFLAYMRYYVSDHRPVWAEFSL